MNGLNRLFLIGNLCADPEVRYSSTGVLVVLLRVATPRARKTGDTWTQETDFHTCTAFGHSATFLRTYAKKGGQVSLECSVRNNNWTDQQGTRHYDTTFLIERVLSLVAKRGAAPISEIPEAVATPECEYVEIPYRDELPPDAWDNGEPE